MLILDFGWEEEELGGQRTLAAEWVFPFEFGKP